MSDRESFPKGFLRDQLDQVEASTAQWPDWMRKQAGLEPVSAEQLVARALSRPMGWYARTLLSMAHAALRGTLTPGTGQVKRQRKKLRPCPFPSLSHTVRPSVVMIASQYQVLCPCGAGGPVARNEAEAIGLWNARVGKPRPGFDVLDHLIASIEVPTPYTGDKLVVREISENEKARGILWRARLYLSLTEEEYRGL